VKSLSFSLLIIVVFLESSRPAIAQCDNCPPPNVVIYGLQMNVSMPPPDSSDGEYFLPASKAAFYNWVALEDVIVPLGAIMNDDPEKSCVNWSEGSLANQLATLPDSSVKVHLENYWTGDVPPAGALGGVDYLIWATLDSSGGQYHFNVYLEDGYTRQRIASGEADFSTASSGVSAATSAISSIEPVFDKIREYQKNLRDNNDSIALSAQITIIPSQPNMDALQTIPVTFQVNDCDGEPLKNRTLAIGGSEGSFDQSSIVTDDNGEATANFTADNVSGVANLTALYYPYMTPMHKHRGSHGDGIVTINNPGLKVWQLNITEGYFVHYNNTYDTTDDYGGTDYTYDDRTFRSNGKFKQYILATITDTSIETTKVYGGSGDMTDFAAEKYVYDESTVNEFENQLTTTSGWVSKDEQFADDLTLGEYKLSNTPTFFFVSQVMEDGVTEVQSYYRDNSGVIQNDGSNPFTDVLDLYPTTFASYPHSPYISSSFSGNQNGATFTGDYTVDSTHNMTAAGGETYHFDAHVTVSITPYMAATAVKSVVGNVPKTFQLYANYPNPFNPSTTISYDLPTTSKVTLVVFDLLGRQIATLVNGRQNPGKYGVTFNGENLPSGVYFYRIQAGSFVQIRKLMLVK
jgi:Secretion system C-terminal sorting domain